MENLRRWTAIHEAGHALANALHGYPAECFLEGGRGLTMSYRLHVNGSLTDLEACRLTLAAGAAAELLCGRPMFAVRARRDREFFAALVSAGEVPENLFRSYVDRATDLLRDHLPALEALARALLAEGHLTPARVREIATGRAA